MGRRLDNARDLYMTAIRDGDYVTAITELSGDRYTQHSTPVRDGAAGFVEFFEGFVDRNPIRAIDIVRSFEDGRHVFLMVHQNLNHGEFQYVTADIFDTDEGGKLIEHWDIIEELRTPTAGDRTQLDGPTEVSDLEHTDRNKALVARYVDEVLVTGHHDRIPDFVADDCAQHHPDIADGSDALRAFAASSALRYVELHLLVGSGDFVATLAEVEANDTRLAVIDLFRVAHDRIVEHWSVVEEITPEATWVNSGKF